MIVAMSRFRVLHHREQDVRQAFLNRQGLVEHPAGFLEVEVFQDHTDCAFTERRILDRAESEPGQKPFEHFGGGWGALTRAHLASRTFLMWLVAAESSRRLLICDLDVQPDAFELLCESVSAAEPEGGPTK